MSKKISLGMALVLMLLAILVTFQITFVALYNKYSAAVDEFAGEMDAYQKLADIDTYYREYYIGEIDEKKLSDDILRGYIAGTGDKYAYYLSVEEYAEMMSDTNAEYEGIGVRVMWSDNTIEIINVMPDSPALVLL